MSPKHENNWKRGSIVYQIYPRSFCDTNGDGVGDLPGIIEKLDYLNDGTDQSLGVDAIWISPFYPSPMADFGYDISDYCAVDPIFGTLEDFQRLLAEAHKRDIKVMIDFVPSHTSVEHAWFKESRSSLDNPKRDWYIWRSAEPDGSPPNNWLSVFGGSVWEYDQITQQYYLHSFLREQPDLNWANPELREAVQSAIRFWLDMGVDGVRLDAVTCLGKDEQLRDNPLNPAYREGVDDPYHSLLVRYSREMPQFFDYLNEIYELARAYPNRFIVTESYPSKRGDVDSYTQFYDKGDSDVAAPFNFELIMLPWEAAALKRFIDGFQAALKPGDVPIYVLGNHDRPRLASRIGREAARYAALVLLTLPGMPFIYYGEELGMENVPIPPDKVHDPFEKNVPGLGLGRDPSRTPMQWSADKYAGFSTAEPWLPLMDDYATCNVRSESHEQESFLSYYRNLIRLRNNSPVLKYGGYEPVDTGNEHVFGYERTYEGQTVVVLLNFSKEAIALELPYESGRLQFSSDSSRKTVDINKLVLQPHEGILLQLAAE